MSSPKKTLRDKCADWIAKNVPTHTRHEYEELLAYNEQLAVALIVKAMDLAALRVAYAELQEELYRTTPTPQFSPHVSLDYAIQERAHVASIRWAIDPMRQNVAVMDYDLVRDRYTLEGTATALREHFMAVVAPGLWQAAQLQLARAAANTRIAA